MKNDRLQEMWNDQREFMELLREKRGFPDFPVSLSEKGGQKFLKGITHECMHELFEANLLLKNSKEHRATLVNDFDRESYIEEISDALHYMFEILIASGITLEEFYSKYMQKGEINKKRIAQGY